MALENLPDFLTVAQAATALFCHPDTVSAMIRRGELKAVRLGRAVRVVTASIETLTNPDHNNGESGRPLDARAVRPDVSLPEQPMTACAKTASNENAQ